MTKNHIKFWGISLTSLCLFAGQVMGQALIKLEAGDPVFEKLPSPELGGEKKWKPKDWLEMEVDFNITNAKPMPKDGFVDSLTVKWYVAVKNPAGKGTLLLEKEIEHVNIRMNETLYSSVYLSPAAIMRLSGSDRASKSVIEQVGGEIFYKGTKVAQFSSRGKGKNQWWSSASLARSQKIPLRDKSETPFKFLYWDRYAEIKVDR